MFDTYVTVVGNVLTAPEWRRTKKTGSLVANFKVASTARRLDRESGRWVDGNSLRVRVTCWRKLAEGVAASVITGDPVVVVGRMYTRDWQDEHNNPRVGYELEAVAVGHDLSRGVARFARHRPALATSAVEDDTGPMWLGGQPTEAVPAGGAPARPGLGVVDDLGEEVHTAFPVPRAGSGGPAGSGGRPIASTRVADLSGAPRLDGAAVGADAAGVADTDSLGAEDSAPGDGKGAMPLDGDDPGTGDDPGPGDGIGPLSVADSHTADMTGPGPDDAGIPGVDDVAGELDEPAPEVAANSAGRGRRRSRVPVAA